MKASILFVTAALVAGCSSATPSPNDQPRANVQSGIHVDISASSVDGTVVDPSHALTPARERLGRCYNDTLAARPGVAGVVSFRIIVESDGRPGRTEVIPDATLGDETFARCVQKTLEGMRFAGPIARTAAVEGTIVFGGE